MMRNATAKEMTAAPPADDSHCATPLGLLPQGGLDVLRAFGVQAERLEYPYIDVGGFIVPGRDPVAINPPGMERDGNAAAARAGGREQPPPEQTGPPTGARKRSPEAAPGASPHALGNRLTILNLDLPALVSFHPLTRIVASTEAVVHFNIPLGIIPELPIGARLTFEVPLTRPERTIWFGQPSNVPDVRAWAVWEGGALHGQHIVSHHRYPDQSICASMPGQWMLGVHPLHDYIAFGALWVAKTLHETLFGFYPGPQHCSGAVRVQRDRPDEFCGCGAHRRYRDCCHDADFANGPFALWRDANAGRARYVNDLARQGRSLGRPEGLLRLGLSTG